MTVYLLLILSIVILDVVLLNSGNRERNFKLAVVIPFVLIFLVMALRCYEVGRDIPGYRRAYLDAVDYGWSDYSYIYYEPGYIFLMKICNAIGLSFQQYLGVIAALILIPIAAFIYKYSNNYLLSIIVYLGYIGFEFDLTGIRQAVSMSLCLIALIIMMSQKKRWLIWFLIIVAIAYSIHNGAIVFAFAPLLKKVRKPRVFLVVTTVATMVLILIRQPVFALIGRWFEKKEDFGQTSTIYFGTSALISCFMIAFFLIVEQSNAKQKNDTRIDITVSDMIECSDESRILFLNMFILSVAMGVFLGTNTTARSFMYYNIVLLVLFPAYIQFQKKKDQTILNIFFSMFFIGYFIINVRYSNNFDIYPYKFFWQ